MDYLSSHINNHGCSLCVEKGMQIEIPARAKVIRVLMDELTRLASHQLWWGAMAMDVGALTPFFLAFREREMINDIMEESCGTRLTMNYMVPGGVMAVSCKSWIPQLGDNGNLKRSFLQVSTSTHFRFLPKAGESGLSRRNLRCHFGGSWTIWAFPGPPRNALSILR